METILAVAIGLGLAAACGFRVFVPPLVLSVAALSGHLHLAAPFEWIGTWPALVAFAAATLLEIAGYYVPWVDHLLDTVSTPAAVVAGTVVMASMVKEMDPWLRWTLAVIAGGGIAGGIQAATVTARATSSILTGGAANPVVATVEGASSLLLSALAVLVPLLAALLAIGLLVAVIVAGRRIIRRLARRATKPGAPPAG